MDWEKFEGLKTGIRKQFQEQRRGAAHDFTHVERVLRNAKKLLESEQADEEIVMYACLLHDLAREAEGEEKGNHASESAKMAREILPKYVSSDKIPAILHAIEAHSRRSNLKPQTPEAKIMWDADKLDFFGRIGLLRYVAQGQELNWELEYSVRTYLEKAEKYLGREIYFTKTGKELGEPTYREAIALAKEALDELQK